MKAKTNKFDADFWVLFVVLMVTMAGFGIYALIDQMQDQQFAEDNLIIPKTAEGFVVPIDQTSPAVFVFNPEQTKQLRAEYVSYLEALAKRG